MSTVWLRPDSSRCPRHVPAQQSPWPPALGPAALEGDCLPLAGPPGASDRTSQDLSKAVPNWGAHGQLLPSDVVKAETNKSIFIYVDETWCRKWSFFFLVLDEIENGEHQKSGPRDWPGHRREH